MKKIPILFGALYHVWYFAVQFLVILTILPFIFITSMNENGYRRFFRWAKIWGKAVLFFMGCLPRINWKYKPSTDQPYIIIANHASELDIMMTFALVPSPFVFIGKKELARIPLFGYFYRRTNILVDRSSLRSKKRVLEMASEKLRKGIGVCIYPEGGIPPKSIELAPFKAGAFKLAIEEGVPILPITYPDNGRRFPDMWEGGAPGSLRATIHPPIETKDLTLQDLPELRERCYQLIRSELHRLKKES
ncbi:MAG: 1-acyl-sn-glycerol-3-phosphate acyltransferase [Bacteroidota bacterium]|nr:1-acyl-sn-glycerol-3-phosphate acyltransferase [Bacteroidota bacterium]MDX5447229.1 1-acyl-sn-glycerol-3-phosphate acyltransferase [Bacteroidota bacterium]MDX5504926.1 1-acyl-sn-glycerol-3-phosphate acyltransferase [Bacteroidota bacterium]